MAYDEKAARLDWMRRKARRVLRTSQHATSLGRVKATSLQGEPIEIEVRRAMRSKGYQSNYEPVLTYWTIVSDNTGPFQGKSWTANAYAKVRRELEHDYAVTLPA